MSNKSKGSNMERELVKLFATNGWRAARVAGSGVGDEAPCDIIAGKTGRRGYVIEVKSSRKNAIYIKKEQIEDFIKFSEMIKVQPALAVRFLREGWLFLDPIKHLRDTGKFWMISLEEARKKGSRFSQYFGTITEEVPHDLSGSMIINESDRLKMD